MYIEQVLVYGRPYAGILLCIVPFSSTHVAVGLLPLTPPPAVCGFRNGKLLLPASRPRYFENTTLHERDKIIRFKRIGNDNWAEYYRILLRSVSRLKMYLSSRRF